MHVHLEGMGLQGCLLAHTLARYGVPFTWHDIDAPHTAWKASTGAIYPADSTNHGPDRECWNVWKAWYENNYFAARHLEKSRGLVFMTKNPPHKGTYEAQSLFAPLKIGADPSFHLNGQDFVRETRERFRPCRWRSDESPKGWHIITHSWGKRFDHAYWGWARLVELDYSALFLTDVRPKRPAFYLRPNRFQMAYAYPVPGTNLYYAGSNIIKQAAGKLKELDAEPKYATWKANFERFSEGRVTVAGEGEFLTGWRPAGADEDTAWIRRKGKELTLRPLWNSGIRHFPAQWQGIAAQLGLIA